MEISLCIMFPTNDNYYYPGSLYFFWKSAGLGHFRSSRNVHNMLPKTQSIYIKCQLHLTKWHEVTLLELWAPPMAEWFWAQNWYTVGARSNSRSRLSILPFGVFPGFLRMSRKFGLGSLRKTLTEDISPIVPGTLFHNWI